MPRLPPSPTRTHLVARRRYRVAQIKLTEAKLARWRAEVAALDAAIKAKGGPVRSRPPVQHPAPRGGMIKAILDTLRQSDRPMRAGEIVTAVSGKEWAVGVALPVLTKRVRVALEWQAANGLLQWAKGDGRRADWSISEPLSK